MDYNKICNLEYCGYFDKTVIVVSGVYNGLMYRTIDETSDLNTEEKNCIRTFTPSNVKLFASNRDLEKAPLLSFKLILDEATNKFSVYKPEVFNSNHPKFPGEIFERQILVLKTQNITSHNPIHIQETENPSSEIYLESFNYGENIPDIKKYLSTANTAPAFIENINVVYNTLVKTGETELCLFSVEPDWLHFDDFIKHGLIDTWNSAFINPDKTYLLVFQNINITLPRCGLTPFFDVINSNRPKLPGAIRNGRPKNLHIFATLLKDPEPADLAIPIDLSLFNNWNVLEISNNSSIKVFDDTQKKAYLSLFTKKND